MIKPDLKIVGWKKLNLYMNRQFPLKTNFKTRQGDANKSPQLERAY